MRLIIENSITLLEALKLLYPDSSQTTLRSLAKEGRVLVENVIQKDVTTLLLPNQTVSISSKKNHKPSLLEILYEDEYFVAVNKPSGILSVKSNSESLKTVESLLNERYKKVIPVHRLDQDTSGVMIFALTQQAEKLFNAMFEKHSLNRVYIGIIEGSLEKNSGTWISYLFEDKNFFVRSSNDPTKGLKAITHYKVIKKSKFFSMVEFTLETGRKNQIRVHAKEALVPLAGDKKYGALRDPIKRLCLHAALLEFIHPFTSKPIKLQVPVPESFNKIFL